MGDPDAYPMLRDLVALAPTNLEDPAHGRWEKPHYPATARYLVHAATRMGLRARMFDPATDLPDGGRLHGVPRPNVVADLDVGATDRVIVMSHYDVVPVPTEQLARWQSPPHVLTWREDGRFYGRGAADDLGSGVVPSLLAAKRLRSDPNLKRNLRLLFCCDEETGGAGGIESLRAHDDRLPTHDPGRFLEGEAVLIPDGDPHATGGSSGVAFLDGSFSRPVRVERVIAFGRTLVDLGSLAEGWKSSYLSPDWPDHGAPYPVLTGRATVTRFDAAWEPFPPSELPIVRAVHAESDATNQVAQSVTVILQGPLDRLSAVSSRMSALVTSPFKVVVGGPTAIPVPAGALALSVVGKSSHAGYPHRGHNPVPATLELLAGVLREGLVDSTSSVTATFGVDLRLPPEMGLDAGVTAALDAVQMWAAANDPEARIAAPSDRARGGYALAPDHPALLTMERILGAVFGADGVFGEYGGTDASSLLGVQTPRGEPIPALVFGLMGRASHIHEAEENLDPRGVAQVTETICRFVLEA